MVIFTWPSDGIWGPLNPGEYSDDRHDAEASGAAFARGLLKFATFLSKNKPCGQRTFLLAHSMGNYVLSNTLRQLNVQSPVGVPKLFDVILSMAADEDSDAFECDDKWGFLPELGGHVVVYINRHDKALLGSELTKGKPDRMGNVGPKHPMNLPAKVSIVDVSKCDPLFDIGHGYYDSWGLVINDVLQVLDGREQEDVTGRIWVPARNRYYIG